VVDVKEQQTKQWPDKDRVIGTTRNSSDANKAEEKQTSAPL